jgi:hypothetical protein
VCMAEAPGPLVLKSAEIKRAALASARNIVRSSCILWRTPAIAIVGPDQIHLITLAPLPALPLARGWLGMSS